MGEAWEREGEKGGGGGRKGERERESEGARERVVSECEYVTSWILVLAKSSLKQERGVQ